MTEGFPALSSVVLGSAGLLVLTCAVGWRYSSWILPQGPGSVLLAPAVGMAIHACVSLLLCVVVGLSWLSLAASVALSLTIGLAPRLLTRGRDPASPSLPPQLLAFAVAAALIAILPILPILPQATHGGVGLGSQIYDHAKVAIIDEIAREGRLPPGIPFFSGPEAPPNLRYYYLLHFVAAQVRLAGITGWEADIASTWFVAFASLLAMAALAVRTAGRLRAAWWVLPLSMAGRLRHTAALFDVSLLDRLLSDEAALPWPDQASWVPQHVISAVLAVLAVISIARLTSLRRWSTQGVLLSAVLAAAAFGFSAWVGGIALACALAATILAVLVAHGRALQVRLTLGHLAATGMLALALASPFLVAQSGLVSERAFPIEIETLPVLVIQTGWRLLLLLNIAGYWLVFLPLELQAVFLPGIAALLLLRSPSRTDDDVSWRLVSASAIVAFLLVAQFMKSTIGSNDLGWRAVIPGFILLTPWAAALLDRLIGDGRPAPRQIGAGLILLMCAAGVPAGFTSTLGEGTRQYFAETPTSEQVAFATAPRLWAAVRRHRTPGERVLNNPASLAELTPWPVNIGWALLADAPSCAAATDLIWTFVQIPRERAEDVMLPLERLFAGIAATDDIAFIFGALRCRIVVLTPADAAWATNALANVPGLTLLEEEPQAWRIYRWVPGSGAGAH